MNSPLQTGRPLIRMALKDYQSIEEVAFRVSMFWQLQQYRSLVQRFFSLKDSRRELRAMLGSDKRSCVRTKRVPMKLVRIKACRRHREIIFY